MDKDAMVKDQERRPTGGVLAAGLFCLISLAVLLVARFAVDPQSWWIDYGKAYQCVGGAALVGSGLWFIFALLKARTDFFSADRAIGRGEFRATLASVLIAVVVALVLVFAYLPSLVPPAQAQMEAVDRVRQARLDKNLKIFVSLAVILAGAIVMSLPLRRLRRGAPPA